METQGTKVQYSLKYVSEIQIENEQMKNLNSKTNKRQFQSF